MFARAQCCFASFAAQASTLGEVLPVTATKDINSVSSLITAFACARNHSRTYRPFPSAASFHGGCIFVVESFVNNNLPSAVQNIATNQ